MSSAGISEHLCLAPRKTAQQQLPTSAPLTLQAETEERQKEAQRAAAASGGILAAAAPPEDIYANPQPLSKTLLPQDDSGAAKEYEGAQFGPSQVGGGAGVLGCKGVAAVALSKPAEG